MDKRTTSRERLRLWLPRAVAVAVLLGIVGMIWHMAGSRVGVRREAPRIATITPLPPPPPPPKEKPPEPKKVEEEIKQTIDKPAEPMKPVDAPKPSNDVAKQVTINSDAQAGSDSFNIGAGTGGGMVGSGGGSGSGTGSYDQYLGYAIQQAVQRDERVNRLVFEVRVDIWMDPDGRLTRAQLVGSTGNQTTDDALAAALRAMPRVDAAPPSTTHFPLRVSIRGRRPG
ncbi:outer membrane transport energization protein TonB [Luteibacter rhizovicinus]|uniref:Outer membrane transport energization protein TonB n=1 Tax=Luteibacter rhizovicinus TaxID=242606 RepID=A0A4R3YHI4_9GAMM|nr:TonB family protein [Luteibacter rhizovicinus]TCV91777.1 outer membrane transport energization protein TonB [Luteibacter rhizovicinus]